MFGYANHASVSADGRLVEAQKQLEEERALAQLQREERWMKEISCLARNVYYEARGESRQGQLAVAMVTLNRVENGLFPDSICGVVNERKVVENRGVVCQFSWRCESWNNPKKRVKATHDSYIAALDAILHYEELTKTLVPEDTLFFHAKHVRPTWRKVKDKLAQIDNHIFYRQRPGDTRR
jgi:spore germination cell wall hydrolase CwlJ-like protein